MIKRRTTQYGGDMPVFWGGEAKILPGGYKLKQSFPRGTIIRKGTPLSIEYGTLSAAVVKYAIVITGGTSTSPRVTKGHNFQVGDILMDITGTIGREVKSIDASDSGYDVITFTSALTGITDGAHLVEATATTGATPKYEPNAVAGEDTERLSGENQDTVSAAYDAVVLLGYVQDIPRKWLIDETSGIALKNNPNIIYIKQ
jgi:hypothetical protein